MTWLIVILPVLCIALYLLYVNGYAVTQAKSAVMYVESWKGCKASFSSCTGFTRRRINFNESRTYHFDFAPELTSGKVSMELLDSEKNKILCLDDGNLSADIELKAKGKYYLVFRFESASGKYILNWN